MSDATSAKPSRSRAGFVVLVGAMLIVLLGLGTWQLQRLQWKEAIIAEREAMVAQAPLVLSSINADAPEFRRVRVSGTLMSGKSLFVGPRIHQGRPGWYLVTPLRLATGGVVMINRGWVPYDKRGDYRDDATGPGNRYVYDGILRRPGTRGPFAPDNVPARDEWYRLDPAAIAQRLDLGTVAPFWVVDRASPGQRSYPTPVGDIALPPNNHLQYVVTWYGLALVLVVIGGLYWRKESSDQT